ncbi:MAG: hypothetical protein H7Y33_04205 [Cytophagales bacterium]|nr:hypothetical protein [Rhizobacter sp.]
MRALAALAVCLVCASTGVQAQTVYRCGPDGRAYSQTPCPQGRAVNVSDERSTEQRSAAEARVREDQTRGDALERERLDREAGKPAAASKIDGRPAPPEPATPASKPSKKKKPKANKAARDDFKAVAPVKKTKNR